MKCPRCQFASPEGMRFCGNCGHQLGVPPDTPSYEEKLARLQRYLPEGLTEKILSRKERIEGEKRQVTIMFCDMKGFTPLTEQLGPAETFTLMDQVFEILIHKVNDYQGTVNELRGDGILAFFGAPIALEDAPQRAVHSALAIHREMARFNRRVGRRLDIPPILLRIGINSGPVVVGTVGNDLRVQFTAMGDTINMASRMEGLAEPGTTYVTGETYRLTRELFRFKALGRKTVKGKGETVPVYQVLSARAELHRPRLGAERMIYAEMIGREEEIHRLELQVTKAIHGEGSVVNIVGEAGIGKSRLIAELKRREVMRDVTLLEGQAISIGRNLSFYPVIDFLKQWARIREGDGEATMLGKLETAVKGACGEDVYEVLPFVATLMSMSLPGRYAERMEGLEGEALEKLMVKNVRHLLSRIAEPRPLVVVVEDLHWADASSVDLLVSLFPLTESRRVVFVNAFRPGHGDAADRVAEGIRGRPSLRSVDLRLRPLDERMSEGLVAGMLKTSGMHHALIDQIVERSGGNPFFIEEVVRSLIDEGGLISKNGGYQVTEKAASISIPNTISDVLMARIDRLDEKTRNVVKTASVIGRAFFLQVLLQVMEDTEGVERGLAYLKSVQLLQERQRMGKTEYLFKHALAQEAAYDSILPRKRKELHLRVAGSIEEVFKERLPEVYGMLAYHYSRGEHPEKAEVYLTRAGEEALKASASSEALHYHREALALYVRKYGERADPGNVAMYEKNIALALYHKGRYEDALAYFDKALRFYWGKLPVSGPGVAWRFSSSFLHFLLALYVPAVKFRKTPTEADQRTVDLFYKKCEVLALLDPKRFFVESFYFLRTVSRFRLEQLSSGVGILLGASGLFSFTGLSFRLSRKTLDFVSSRMGTGDEHFLLLYDWLETIHLYFEGDWQSIGDHDEALVREVLRLGRIYDASQHLYWHGFVAMYRGSFPAVDAIVRCLDEIVEAYDHDISRSLRYELNTNRLIERRDLPEALREVEEGIAFMEKAGLTHFLIEMLSCRAWILVLMEDLEQAGSALEQAGALSRETDTVPFQLSNYYRARTELDLVRLRRASGGGSEAERGPLARSASDSSRRLVEISSKVAQHRTDAHRLRGVYCWLVGKQKKAIGSWRKAVAAGEALGANLELSRTYFEIGKRLSEDRSRYRALDGVAAEGYLRKARSLFHEMGLGWDLNEMARAGFGSAPSSREAGATG